mgnify:CR=1 FL=1
MILLIALMLILLIGIFIMMIVTTISTNPLFDHIFDILTLILCLTGMMLAIVETGYLLLDC